MTGPTSDLTTALLDDVRSALDRADAAPSRASFVLALGSAAGAFRRLDELLSRGELLPRDWTPPDLDPD